MTIDQLQARMVEIRNREHAHCFVCGTSNRVGLRLNFHVCEDGGVVASFPCSGIFQGYAGLLHGGVISSLLDGAMTNCMFAQGKAVLSGELTVRYLHPVAVDREATIKAWVKMSYPPMHVLEAELSQDSKILARATGKFMERTANTPCRRSQS